MNYSNTQQTLNTTRQTPHPNFQYISPALNGRKDDAAIMEAAFGRFFDLLDKLEAKGVPKAVVNQSIDRLIYFINIGVEPTLAQLLGIDNNYGLSGYLDNLADNSIVKGGGDPLSTGSEMIGNIVDMFKTGDVTGTMQKNFRPGSLEYTIASLIPKDILNDTFGAVFANGFNLSCWNSTFTPSEVTQEVSKIHVPYFTKALEMASNSKSTEELEANFNVLLKAVDISYKMYAEYLPNGANWRSCSEEAIQIYTDIVTGAKTQTDILLENLMKKYNITVTTKTVPAEFTYTQAYTGQPDFTWSEKQHGNATYRIIKFNERLEDSLPVQENVNEIGSTGANQQQAGFGLFSMLVLAGIGFGLYRASQNTPKTKNTTTQPPHTK